MRYFVVVPAAGSGRRLASTSAGFADVPKQYLEIAGHTVLEHALAPFLADARCARVVVAIAPADARWPVIERSLGDRRLCAVAGGAERADSVRLALAALHGTASAEAWVLVHDAARPCLSAAELSGLVTALQLHDVGGLLALPLADTVKRAAPRAGRVSSNALAQVDATLDREDLWRALTPQMFRFAALTEALSLTSLAGRVPTDEAQAIEWLGLQPQLVAGDARNIKITTAVDLELAAALLAARNSSPAG